jgi:outer membrane protein assembly factor BamB
MVLDLAGKKWPPRPERVGWASRHDAYVIEGQMLALALGFPGMAMPIPADEAYVTALAIDRRQTVYGGTGGRNAHLFAGLTRGVTGAVIDMCVLQPDARTTAVLVASDRRVFAATAPGGPRPDSDHRAPGAEGEGALFVHKPSGLVQDLIHEWHFLKEPAEKVAVPLPGEGIACAVMAAGPDGSEQIVGIGEKTGTLFSYDIASGKAATPCRVDEHGLFSRTVVVGPDGKVYGTAAGGTLWRFDPVSHAFELTGLSIPSLAGRAIRNHADSLAVDSDRGVIYGGGTADGVLFAFDPGAGRVKSLGKVTCFRGIKGLAVTLDGRLFGISGREGDIGHLFCYDPDAAELSDLGLAVSVMGPRVHGYQFSCSVVGRDGQVFFGEYERGGHLWLYWPAIRRSPSRPAGARE